MAAGHGCARCSTYGLPPSRDEGVLKADVDSARMVLRLQQTKTGKSIRPIGAAALAVIKEASTLSASKYVFPSITSEHKHHAGLTRWLKGVAAEAVPGITSHGLRHSFGSTAEDLGFSLPTIKALLGHAGSSVTEGYIHKVDFRAGLSGFANCSTHRRNNEWKEIPERSFRRERLEPARRG